MENMENMGKMGKMKKTENVSIIKNYIAPLSLMIILPVLLILLLKKYATISSKNIYPFDSKNNLNSVLRGSTKLCSTSINPNEYIL